MIETAIPVNHSFIDAQNFISPPNEDVVRDTSISELTEHPGWLQLEEKLRVEISRLGKVPYEPGDTMELYGLKVFAAQLTIDRLEWIIKHVRGTAGTVAEREG